MTTTATTTPNRELVTYEVVRWISVPMKTTFQAPEMGDSEVISFAESECDWLGNDDEAVDTDYYTINGHDYYTT